MTLRVKKFDIDRLPKDVVTPAGEVRCCAAYDLFLRGRIDKIDDIPNLPKCGLRVCDRDLRARRFFEALIGLDVAGLLTAA